MVSTGSARGDAGRLFGKTGTRGRSVGAPGETWSVTATGTLVLVEEPDVALVGAIVIVPLKGLAIGSSVANTVGSTETKICATEPESATPLVVRLEGKPLWLTRSQTGVLVAPPPPPPAEATLAAVTVNGMTSPLDDT